MTLQKWGDKDQPVGFRSGMYAVEVVGTWIRGSISRGVHDGGSHTRFMDFFNRIGKKEAVSKNSIVY